MDEKLLRDEIKEMEENRREEGDKKQSVKVMDGR